MTQGPRYRFVLVQEPATSLPVRYRRARPVPLPMWRVDPLEVLVEAFLKLSHRSEGEAAWAPVLSDNPLTFMLDALGDAVLVRHPDGRLAYANPAARRLGAAVLEPLPGHLRQAATGLDELEVGGTRYERRCMVFGGGRRRLVLEVVRRL